MKMIKQHLGWLPKCYAVTDLLVDGKRKYLFATDDSGPCIAVDSETGESENVWAGPGGTMSLVPLPNTNGEFLASQNFMPGFTAREATIVRVRYRNKKWEVEPWLELPYVHRFDILDIGGTFFFLSCILSATEKPQADFSTPGTLLLPS